MKTKPPAATNDPPGGPTRPDRRRFLKAAAAAGAAGAAAYAVPTVVLAQPGGGPSPGPLPLPFEAVGPGGGPHPGQISGQVSAVYNFDLIGGIRFDAQGNVGLDDATTTGAVASGSNALGEITIIQDGLAQGTLDGINLDFTVPVAYLDSTTPAPIAAVSRILGTASTAGQDYRITTAVDDHPGGPVRVDVDVEINCCTSTPA